MKNTKRILSAVMAMTMVAGMTSVNAFADAATQNKSGVAEGVGFAADSTAVVPLISVVLPDTAAVKVDPYNLAGKGQIYSGNAVIENHSDVPVTIGFTNLLATATEDSGIKVVKKLTTPTEDYNEATVALKVTDGLNKATSIALSVDAVGEDGKAIDGSVTAKATVISQAMAPWGGKMKVNVTGTTTPTANILKDYTNKDNITVSFAYDINAQPFKQISATTAVTNANVMKANGLADGKFTNDELPDTLIYGTVEVPVKWTAGVAKIDETRKPASTAITKAQLYPATVLSSTGAEVENKINTADASTDGLCKVTLKS